MGRGSDAPWRRRRRRRWAARVADHRVGHAQARGLGAFGERDDGRRDPRCALVTTTCVAPGLDVLVWWARRAARARRTRRGPTPADAAARAAGEAASLLDAVQRALAAHGLDRAVLAIPALVGKASGASFVDVALQERNATDAIRRARAQGMDWIFHFDDDELLYLTTPRGARAGDVVAAARPGSFNLRLDNLEVQRFKDDAVDSDYNFFAEETRFKLRVGLHADGSAVPRHHDPRFYVHGGNPASGADGLTAPYLSYWNGKSAGRLAEPGLRPCGVHFFAAARGDAAKNDARDRAGTKHIPHDFNMHAQDRGAGIVLLHFPFCHFRTWRHKFNVLDATQRSDWGHYRDARLAIVDACAPGGGGEAEIERFYRKAIMLRSDGDAPPPEDDGDRVALYLPPVAAPQHWRSGVYERVERGAAACYRRSDAEPATSPRGAADPPPASFLYRVPEKKMWLVGSTPGATTGAAVVYDGAERPEDIAAGWCVFDGASWVKAPTVGVAPPTTAGAALRRRRAGQGARAGPRRGRAGAADGRARGAAASAGAASAAAARRCPRRGARGRTTPCSRPSSSRPWTPTSPTAASSGPPSRAPLSRQRRRRRLREPRCGGARRGHDDRRRVLVAERMVGTPAHLATARDVVAGPRESAAQLDAHGKDAVILSIPGAEGVQSWRAGLYAKVDAPPAGHPPLLYKRVRDRPGEQDSFLYTLPDRGMWLVGSTPGSTTGGLVAYDKARALRDLRAPWHVFDGKSWAQAPGVALSLVGDVAKR
ncbi:hypothetical protein JL720_3978 [Aureococcus anophagefferens]|nr:hypothetical protein JL720_3978 [Aureococcus anophagefferens]